MSSTTYKAPGTMSIYTTTATTSVDMSYIIPKQVLLLQSVYIQLTGAASALAERICYIELPFLNSQTLIDNNLQRTCIPVFLENNAVTIQQTLQLPIYTNNTIPKVYTIRFLNSSFQPISNFVAGGVIFTFNEASTT